MRVTGGDTGIHSPFMYGTRAQRVHEKQDYRTRLLAHCINALIRAPDRTKKRDPAAKPLHTLQDGAVCAGRSHGCTAAARARFLHPAAEHNDRNIGFYGPQNFGAVGLSGSARTAPLVAQMESRTADPATLPLRQRGPEGHDAVFCRSETATATLPDIKLPPARANSMTTHKNFRI